MNSWRPWSRVLEISVSGVVGLSLVLDVGGLGMKSECLDLVSVLDASVSISGSISKFDICECLAWVWYFLEFVSFWALKQFMSFLHRQTCTNAVPRAVKTLIIAWKMYKVVLITVPIQFKLVRRFWVKSCNHSRYDYQSLFYCVIAVFGVKLMFSKWIPNP